MKTNLNSYSFEISRDQYRTINTIILITEVKIDAVFKDYIYAMAIII